MSYDKLFEFGVVVLVWFLISLLTGLFLGQILRLSNRGQSK